MRKLLLILPFLLVACPKPCYQIFFANSTSVPTPSSWQKTPKGIRYHIPTNVNEVEFVARLDRYTDDLETCLKRPISRSCIRVIVPKDWYVSTYSGEQLVPSKMNPALCRSKGLVLAKACEWVERPTTKCPHVCNFRATVQDSKYIISAPNLKLYKAELVSMLYNNRNPWSAYGSCLSYD